MTAPVVQAPGEGAAGWTIRFTMPAGLSLDTLPRPDDPQVRLAALPSARYAVVRFSGLAYPRDVEAQTARLETFIRDRGLRIEGAPSLARYDPPWTLWFLRRNEVMIPIAR
jgi:effector-binding domain-containing protein